MSATPNRWSVYLKERFPIVKNSMVPAGMSVSAYFLCKQLGIEVTPVQILFPFLAILVFLGELRLMDELKDFAKDVVAHPERPLPRGLLSKDETANAIRYGLLLMALLSAGASIGISRIAGALYAFNTLYLYLMYREFFVGQRLAKRPFWYAVSHQIVIFPLISFAIACYSSEAWMTNEGLWLSTAILGAFFSYEVGRKLDPKALPILETYLVWYGRGRTAFVIAGTLSLSAIAAYSLKLGPVLWPFQLLAILSLPVLWTAPDRYKIPEGATTLALLIHLWGLPLGYALLRNTP